MAPGRRVHIEAVAVVQDPQDDAFDSSFERDLDTAGLCVAGTMFRWRGADGSTITSEKKGDTVFLKLGKDILSERSVKPVKAQAASTVSNK